MTLLLAFCGYIFKVKVVDKNQISSPDELIVYFLVACRCLNSNDFKQNKMQKILSISIYRRHLQHRMKIYIIFYQILVALPFVLSLNISTAFDAMMSALSFVNVGIAESSVASCSFGSNFDFVDKLLFQTIYPVVVILELAVACRVHVLLKRKEEPATFTLA